MISIGLTASIVGIRFLISTALLAQLAHSISSNCFYMPNIALTGGTYDEFQATEIKHCCIACARDPCCIAYTFDKLKSRCYMKAAISESYRTSTMTSGLKANSHAGQGSTLRNIKIHGGTGTASMVKLPNSEDCMQYCTAYGMFSWSPPTKEATEEGEKSQSDNKAEEGDCSCMSRISSLEYSFGSKSAVFPPVSNLN